MKRKTDGKKIIKGIGTFCLIEGFFGLVVGLLERNNEEVVAITILMFVIGGVFFFVGGADNFGKRSSSKSDKADDSNQYKRINIGGLDQISDSQISESATVRYCPRCGRANPGDALFCSQDGERLI